MSPKRWKSLQMDWTDLQSHDDTTIVHVCLTQQQIAILKASLIPAYWSTRWTNLTITKDELDAFVAKLDGQLDGNECGSMDCDDVADCIETSENVTDALINYLTINNFTGGIGNPDEVLPEEIREENLLPEDFSCDNDHRYGAAVGIVQAIHDATAEVFQKIEVLTNPLELVAEIADNVPVVEAAGIAGEVIIWVQDTAYEAYNAAWSDVVKDEISCEIFCLMQDEFPCHFDYEMLMDVYLDEDFPFPPSILDSWLVWAEWLLLLPFTDDRLIVKLCGLLGLLTMRYGGKFGQFILGVRSLKTTIALLADDTNPDWETLCTECPEEWIHFWDFENFGMEAWELQGDYGEYVAGVGVVTQEEFLEQDGDWRVNVIRHLRLDEAIPRCWRFIMHRTIVRGTFNPGVYGALMLQPPMPGKQFSQGLITTGTGIFTSEFNLANLEYVEVHNIISCYAEGPVTGSIIITGITLKGQGTDPFEDRETS